MFRRLRENPNHQTRALIFDSYYDDYRGVILYLRIVDGEIAKNSQIKMLATDAEGLRLKLEV
jgi:GTP-binding protein LepA